MKGIGWMLATQQNAWIHAAATVTVVATGFYVEFTRSEWCWIVLAIMSVWTAEGLNTAFEFLTDVASPEFHPLAGKAKDVAAGAVMMSAFGAIAIGLIVIGPHLWRVIFGAGT
jgi:diacylglycerol kinase (ATP)